MKSKDGNKVISQWNGIPDEFFIKFTTVSICITSVLSLILLPLVWYDFRNCEVTDFMENVLASKEQILEFLLQAQLSDGSGFFNIG